MFVRFIPKLFGIVGFITLTTACTMPQFRPGLLPSLDGGTGADPGDSAAPVLPTMGANSLPADASGILVQAANNTIVLASATVPQVTPFAQAGFAVIPGSYPITAIANGKLYVVGNKVGNLEGKIYEVSPAGVRELPDYGTNVQGIALFPVQGTPDNPLIAWSTVDPSQDSAASRLMIAPVDGSDAVVAVEQAGAEGFYFVPIRWSVDGQRLYYSQEVPGPQGSIQFGGFPSLYVYDASTKEATSLLPSDVLGGLPCLEDVSPDEQWAAHHCGTATIAVASLDSTDQVLIQPPGDLTDWEVIGSARFSPDSSRIAFAVARVEPENEQGWVLVSDDLVGPARIIATSASGDFYRVVAWLDDDTLVLQSYGQEPTVWLAEADVSAVTFVSAGYFLGLLNP